jgi:hypothetical protein
MSQCQARNSTSRGAVDPRRAASSRLQNAAFVRNAGVTYRSGRRTIPPHGAARHNTCPPPTQNQTARLVLRELTAPNARLPSASPAKAARPSVPLPNAPPPNAARSQPRPDAQLPSAVQASARAAAVRQQPSVGARELAPDVASRYSCDASQAQRPKHSSWRLSAFPHASSPRRAPTRASPWSNA